MKKIKFCANCGNPKVATNNLYPCECLINQMRPKWVSINLSEDNAWSVAKIVAVQFLREDGKITTDEKDKFIENECYWSELTSLEESAFDAGTFDFDFNGILECQYDNVFADIQANRS